jgi:hypothetical protein
MTTVIYKNILGKYLIHKIFESAGTGVTLTLEEPIDAKATIGEDIWRFEKGVCRIGALKEGEVAPKLYTGSIQKELESFFYKNGTAHLTRDPNGFMAEILTALGMIEERVSALETANAELSERVSRKISFLGYSNSETEDTKKK